MATKDNNNHKTKVQDKWLTKTDKNNIVISQWASKIDDDVYKLFCKICVTSFKIEKGFDKINQHAETEKHKKNLFKLKDNQQQIVISTNRHQSLPEASSGLNSTQHIPAIPSQAQLSLFNLQEAASRAELFTLLEIIVKNRPLSDCDTKKELYQVMFPGSVPDKFSLSRTKAAYLLVFALAPYFQNMFISELKKENVYYALQYDETGNVKSQKQLQVRLQYWSEIDNLIINRHLETYFIEKGDAEVLLKYVLKALDSNDLSIQHVLALSKDGPNVNKKLVRLFQEKVKASGSEKIYDMTSCLLHVARNAFSKGIECFDINVDDFIVKIYYFFHHQHLRTDNFKTVQISKDLLSHSFIKHCDTRWLTLGPACERAIEQLPALNEYFFKYIPTHHRETTTKKRYIEIIEYLKEPSLQAVLEFITYIARTFSCEFTAKMQKQEPLIHILFPQFKKLLYLLCTNIVKSDSSIMTKSLIGLTSDELFDKVNLKDLSRINCGEKSKESISFLTEKQRMLFFISVQKCHKAMIKHLLEKLANVKSLRYFEALDPSNIKKQYSSNYIVQLAKLLPIKNIDVDLLKQEWQLLQIDPDVSFDQKKDQRIDEYWLGIFSLQNPPSTRYPLISIIVKSALSIPHGSADVERGFSESGNILTKDRANLEEKTLNAILIVRDALKSYDSKAHKVPITTELLKLVKNARREYSNYLDELQREKEEAKKLNEAELLRLEKEQKIAEHIKDQVDSISKLENDLQKEKEEYKKCTEQTSLMQKVLGETVKLKTSASAAILPQLISNLDDLRNKELDCRKKVDKLNEQIVKRKSKIIDSNIKKKLKTS